MADMGTLAVKLEAKTAEFKRRMTDAKKSVSNFSGDSIRSTNKLDRAITNLGSNMTRVAGIIGVGATGIAGAVLTATNQLVNQGREIENLSRLAGTSAVEFQRLAVASRRYGLESDKVADILKDMNDRVGDFIQTGGGPMADFFENIGPKVGVTAEHFRDLSGADALQLYVSSLEKANLSQADMTFYMEAIASDSTALLPLLRDNGTELARIGDEAERTGQVLSDLDLQKLAELDTQLVEIKGKLEGVKNEVLIGALPAMQDFADLMNDEQTTKNLQTLANAAVKLATWMGKAASETANFTEWVGEELAARINGISKDDIPRMQQRLEAVNEMLESTNFGAIDFFKGEFYSKDELRAEAEQLKRDIEAALKAQEITAPVDVTGDSTGPQDNGKKADDLRQSNDKNSDKTDKNTESTDKNTESMKELKGSIDRQLQSTADRERTSTTEGGESSRIWDQFIRRNRTIAGSTQANATDRAVFENGANALIARFEAMGGFDTDAMREQMDEIARRMGESSKHGMTEAARELTGGEGAKNIGSITINVKSESGTESGEVTGDSAFLSKLANTLSNVSTAV